MCRRSRRRRSRISRRPPSTEALQQRQRRHVAAGGDASNGSDRGGSIFVRGFQTRIIYRDGFRVDGQRLAASISGLEQLGNVQSVEVLKGPAAILYGLSEPGGIVNLTTKDPRTRLITLSSRKSARWLSTARASAPPARSARDNSVLYQAGHVLREQWRALRLLHRPRPTAETFSSPPSSNGSIDESTWVKAGM